jgi:beta-lysine 5,6-aminomutase alpha subunit
LIRLICSRAKIVINTGEDNYLTTSDAIENAYTVTGSQLINEAMAKKALLTDDLLGLGHAFEIDPEVENAFQVAPEIYASNQIQEHGYLLFALFGYHV